jgi:sugar (pentulose or hexulose) kinase
LPPGRHEQAPDRLLELAVGLLSEIRVRLGDKASDVRGIGFSGQMHGALLVDGDLQPVTNLVTWQDQRGAEQFPGTKHSCLDECISRVGRQTFERAAISPATGYMGVTLFCLKESSGLPRSARYALMCHDWLAARLAACEPATDPTDAASSGLYDVRERRWAKPICEALSLDTRLLPPVREAGDALGRVHSDFTKATGLPSETTVHVPLGDNQASVLASMSDPMSEVLLNIGTGAQTSAVTDLFFTAPDIEPRPFPGRKVLACGAGLCGGAAFRYLAEHYAQAIRELTGADVPVPQVLTKLVELAAEVPAGSHGLRIDPFFQGKRSAPSVRGAMSGMGTDNNSPGAWARALTEGMARSLAGHYETMLKAGLEPRRRLVASGNALRLNPVLRQAASDAFGMPLAMPAWDEEAACGAALAAMVGSGALDSFEAAASLVRYAEDKGRVPTGQAKERQRQVIRP